MDPTLYLYMYPVCNRFRCTLVHTQQTNVIQFYFGDIATFILCMLSIIPLSKLLGTGYLILEVLLIGLATEELALRTGETVGGLLNATFGNAVELIISIVALKDGLLRIVQV